MGVYGSPDLNYTYTRNNNNMVYCTSCGFYYSKILKKCPKCGKRHAQPFYHKWWFWFFVVIIFIFASSLNYDYINVSNTVSSTPTEGAIISEVKKQETSKEKVVITEEEYKEQCTTVSYVDIARNPNNYVGVKTVFEGQVIQVQESGNSVVLRINVTKGEYGFWEDTIYVDYRRKKDNESRVLEEDIVTVYGEIKGLKSYTAVFGNEITIPHMKAEYITVH